MKLFCPFLDLTFILAAQGKLARSYAEGSGRQYSSQDIRIFTILQKKNYSF
jgi:hypothetical protein